MKNILILSSDRVLSRFLQITLEDAGYAAAVSSYPHPAETGDFDAIIADACLLPLKFDPVCNLIVCGYTPPAEPEKYFGFLLRPFRTEELLRELEAASLNPSEKKPDEFTLDEKHRRVIYLGNSASLTERETELLSLLVKNRGKTVTRDEIINSVFGGASSGNVDAVYINYLRRKLSALSDKQLIVNVRHTGYKLNI